MRKKPEKKGSFKPLPAILIWIAALFLFFYLFSDFQPSQTKSEKIPFSQIVRQINDGSVKKLLISESEVKVLYSDRDPAIAIKEPQINLSESLLNLGAEPEKLRNIEIEFETNDSVWSWLFPVLITVIPPLLVLVLLWVMLKQAKSGAMQTFDFTKAKARLFGAGGKNNEKTTFEDVAGLEEAKDELKEIIDFLKNPVKYFKMGAKIPRGVLLVGPPGCGKTLLARAVANEAGVPFFSISGSEFIELFVGVGASRVRNLFAQAKRAGKAIIFIDEIDSIGRTRGFGFGGGHEEREQTLNQILAEMDGFERESGVIVTAATNRPDTLDPALLRPGRFDRRIVLDLPDVKDRGAILKIHSRGKPLAQDVDLKEISERTPGFSGADLESLVNEAALLAAKQNQKEVFQKEFLEAIEKVLLGPERKSHILNKKEKEIAAYHEAGHALVASSVEGTEEVRKISIIARGLAAGYTLKMPKEERKIKKKSELLAEIAILFGGYTAEQLIFNEITTGAADDIKKASLLARKIVKQYGMSSLGPIAFGEREEMSFLNQDMPERKNYSQNTATKIDQEVSSLIEKSKTRAQEILKEKKEILEVLAKTLIEKETIEKEEFEKIVESG